MRIREVLDEECKRRSHIGGWDWEAVVAHKSGRTELPQRELMQWLKHEDRVEQAQREADEDARLNARRLAVVIDGFFTDEECDALIAKYEGDGLLSATKSKTLQRMMVNCNFEDGDEAKARATLELGAQITARMQARLLEIGTSAGDEGQELMRELHTAHEWSARDYHARHGEGMELRLVGMSDYIRVMRYSAAADGGDFDTDPRNAHHDGRNRRPAGDSFLTALLYLNSEDGQGLQGGGTLFLDAEGETLARVSPKKGSLLIFDHHLFHRGEGVVSGVKHVARSDLLYRAYDRRTGECLDE